MDTAYNDKTSVAFARLADRMAKLSSTPLKSVDSAGGASTSSVNIKLHDLKIVSFADNSNDSFEFLRFYTSFTTALNSMKGVTKSANIVYFMSFIQGRALALVENLPIEDDSYDLAWPVFRSEFFDRDLLVNDTLSCIINWPMNSSLNETMIFIFI